MYSFSTVVIENLYIQTSLMVALSLFRVKEGGGPIYKSEVDIINYIYIFLCLLQCNITVYTYLFIYAVNE